MRLSNPLRTAMAGKRKWIVLLAGVGAMLFLFIMLGPPQVFARTESPAFCGGCHTMQSEFEAWFHTGAHRRKDCVDCHLPNDNVALHYVWKSIDGMKDTVLQYTGAYPEQIKLSSHGAEVVQTNCIRCHSSTVEFIDPTRKCWECHRRVMHKRSGAIETG
jgi:cytochrome c nitrite reductase small subunit